MWRRFVHHTRACIAAMDSSQNGDNSALCWLRQLQQGSGSISRVTAASKTSGQSGRRACRARAIGLPSLLQAGVGDAASDPSCAPWTACVLEPDLTRRREYLHGDTVTSEESQDQMLGAQVAVPEVEPLAERELLNCSLAK
jgi:hypothetical protein